MVLKLYNTLSRKKEEFKPIKKGEVGMYTCGPTVYWYQHIGNLRSYIFSDILKRVLLWNRYKVKQVMNVTDVGHLTSDADIGEDKMEKAAKKEGKSAWQIAEFYWKIFKEDFKKLNIIGPDIWCKATEHISEQIALIQKLEKKSYTYKTSDGIYFNTSKLKDYGKLARLKIKNLQVVAIEQDKRSVSFQDAKYSFPIALVVGHETHGISKEVLDICDQIVELPMYGINTSLNVMVSLGIVLYHAIKYLE